MEDPLEHPDTVGTESGLKVISVSEMDSHDLLHAMIFLMGIISQLFLLTGGNGAMDSVPHFLLGRSDRTESQEDL